MKVVDIKNLQREEGHIFYLRKYEGDAVLELPTSVETTKIKFSIEMSRSCTRMVESWCEEKE